NNFHNFRPNDPAILTQTVDLKTRFLIRKSHEIDLPKIDTQWYSGSISEPIIMH
ncbi:MAG: hypothetical protein ACI85U_004392, partial [Candidatus Promineifilaceae bacterium]